MRRTLQRVSPVLHLTRVSSAFAAVANVWFVILWTRALEQERGVAALTERPEWVLLLAGAVTAVGLYAFGVSLNDFLDVRRDHAMRRERPIPMGQLSSGAAVIVVTLTLLAAVLGATVFGTGAVLMTLVVVFAILFFNAAGRFVPAVGLVALGLVYAGHMVAPNVNLRFVWPVWVVMTHALAVGTAAHVIGRKVPRLSRRALAAAICGWIFWSGVLFVIGLKRAGPDGHLWPDWVSPSAAVWPVALAVVYGGIAWRRAVTLGPGRRAADRIRRLGSFWLSLYAVAWFVGVGRMREALILAVLATVGLLGMTVLRELYGLIEQPVGYRR